jgi:hypothetical protein
MIDDIPAEAAGFVVRQVGGLAVDLTVKQIFSRHSARFFHGVGRRAVAVSTLGAKRIPSSLRIVPEGSRAKPRRSDWLALWIGVLVWIALFLSLGAGVSHFL